MKTWQSILLGLFLGILFTAAYILIARQPTGQSVELLPAPTFAPIVVQVAGEVVHPGVYSLPPKSRVQDAILAAGGFTQQADQSTVNLAARLRDGEKVFVPPPATPVPTSLPGSQPTVKLSATPTRMVIFPIDLNTATLDELDALPGIGPTRAKEIMDYREKHGGFKDIEEIKNVPGIGDATYNQIKGLIVVQTSP